VEESSASPSSSVIDLTTLILAEEPKAAPSKPLGSAKTSQLHSLPQQEEESSTALARLEVRTPAPDMPIEFRAKSDEAVLSQTWSASDSKSNKKWMGLAIAAAVLIAVGAGGTYYLRHRASGPQTNVSGSSALGTQPVVAAAAQPGPGSEAANAAASQPVNPALNAASKLNTQPPAPNTVNSNSKTPAKSPNGSEPAAVVSNASASGAASKAKAPAAVFKAGLVPSGRPAAQTQDPVAPNVGGPIPGGVSSALMPGSFLAQPAAPIPTGGRVQNARILSSVSPVYPLVAKRARVQGDVIIQADIDTAGKITGMKVVSGPSQLQQAALDALHQWKFAPAMLNGQAVSTQMTVKIQFRL
jgi:TonB family protein